MKKRNKYKKNKTMEPDKNGFFGQYGGAYIPEILYKVVHDLQDQYKEIIDSKEFQDEYELLLKDYVGRPSPLYYAKRMSEKYGCKLYLKREDLNHTGAHKINNTIGQILMAKKMGKTRVIAETAPDSTAWPRPPFARCSTWSARFSWARPTWSANTPTWSA